MSLGACDGCGQYFAGEVYQVREALCPGCGDPIRFATREEAQWYVDRWGELERPPPRDGDPPHDERADP